MNNYRWIFMYLPWFWLGFASGALGISITEWLIIMIPMMLLQIANEELNFTKKDE